MFVAEHPGAMAASAHRRLAGGVLWAAVGKMFTAFVVYSTRLTIVYAGFAFIVVALVWTYLGWLILLAGRRSCRLLHSESTYLRLGTAELRLSCVGNRQLALKIMYLVGRAHLTGGKAGPSTGFHASLELPGSPWPRWARAAGAGRARDVTDDDELLCARDISRITVYEVLAWRAPAQRTHGTPNTVVPVVDRLTRVSMRSAANAAATDSQGPDRRSARSAPGTASWLGALRQKSRLCQRPT